MLHDTTTDVWCVTFVRAMRTSTRMTLGRWSVSDAMFVDPEQMRPLLQQSLDGQMCD